MDEKEWMNDFIYQRMELHWQELYRSKTDDGQEESRILDRLENIQKRLTKKREKNHRPVPGSDHGTECQGNCLSLHLRY